MARIRVASLTLCWLGTVGLPVSDSAVFLIADTTRQLNVGGGVCELSSAELGDVCVSTFVVEIRNRSKPSVVSTPVYVADVCVERLAVRWTFGGAGVASGTHESEPNMYLYL